MIKKYVCIHGHFYQPPRENAWVEEVELQDSAAPFHDWNERVAYECYKPNGVARVLNNENKIVDIVNNYGWLSYNFGPTLLSWLSKNEPETYKSIIEADNLSMEHFDGHGSAIAQVYNHIIMPLASRRDKETQVIWGIYDFQKHFGRDPEGMWLAETAVDIETLEVLAENDIRFTILAPYQAKQFRKIGENEWTEGIDTKRAYRCNLPSGNSINLFFYDGENSQGVAFNGYLNDGEKFSKELLDSFDDRDDIQLVHIATDGESYGHHHKSGEMALASCIRHLQENDDVRLINYSHFLALEAPAYEVEINENTSWSCAHGIERWRSDCGCHTGGNDSWNQKWRVGLRTSLDWLRDELYNLYIEELQGLTDDPKGLRNSYVEFIEDRREVVIDNLLASYIKIKLGQFEKTKVIRLLEMQKQAQYMFTSCGWFFNEISGIETTQILQYANRAIQLAEETTRISLHNEFRKRLKEIESNIDEFGTGMDIYTKWVEPRRLSLTQVGMHYAVNALFEDDVNQITVLNYDCKSEELDRLKGGTMIFLSGITSVVSRVTLSGKKFSFAIIYMGNHHLIGGTSNNTTVDWYNETKQAFATDFNNGNLANIIDRIKEHFSEKTFSFHQLFKDHQDKLIKLVIEDLMKGALASYEDIFDSTYSLMKVLKSNRLSIPGLLENNLRTVFQYKIEEILEGNGDLINIARLERYVEDIAFWEANLRTERISYLASKKIGKLVNSFNEFKDKSALLSNFEESLRLLEKINIKPGIESLQELIFRIINNNIPDGEELVKANSLADLIRIKTN